MKQLVAVFVALAAIGTGSAAMAQSAMSGDAMHGAMGSTPTMVCRAAATGEAANSHMGSEALICKSFDFAKAKMMLMNMLKDASASGAPTQAQIDAAYQKAYGDMSLLGQHN